MIIYNIRNNGPYEYEKFVLNIFQIYNLIYDEKQKFAQHQIHDTLEYLNQQITELTKEDSLGNELSLIHISRTEKR